MNAIIKTNKILSHNMESAPFVWNDNKIYYIQCVRTESPFSTKLQLYDFETNQQISEFGYGLGLMSCIVENNTLYVFATTNWTTSGNKVQRIKSTDLINWSSPVDILVESSSVTAYNTSICKNPINGEFVLVIEQKVNSHSYIGFNFWKSTTGIEGTFINFGEYFGGIAIYAACPSIRCTTDGDYYVWFLTNSGGPGGDGGVVGITAGNYYERLVKLNGFTGATWKMSLCPFLAPEGTEAKNVSDLDLIHHQGITYIFYAAGNQAAYPYGWSYSTYATFSGTIDELITSLYIG